jgi:hypothetical protein
MNGETLEDPAIIITELIRRSIIIGNSHHFFLTFMKLQKSLISCSLLAINILLEIIE